MEDKIKALRAEADTLEQELKYRTAYATLEKASRTEWEVMRSLEFPEELSCLRKAMDEARRYIAVKLGHDTRVDTLVACGMDRGRAEIGSLTTDEEAAYSLSTWLFDTVGFYGDNERLLGLEAPEECLEHCPMGVEFWKAGRHDT